jgi:hypothetical protein
VWQTEAESWWPRSVSRRSATFRWGKRVNRPPFLHGNVDRRPSLSNGRGRLHCTFQHVVLDTLQSQVGQQDRHHRTPWRLWTPAEKVGSDADLCCGARAGDRV